MKSRGALSLLAIFVVASAVLSHSCARSCARSSADVDLKPPPGFTPPAVHALQPGKVEGRLGFGRGFWPMELAEGKTWRWMADRGEIRLANKRTRQRLRIVGWIPLEFLAGPPTIQLTLHGRPLDRFVAREIRLHREYVVEPEILGHDVASALLVIETSATAVVPGDTRHLGVSIEELRWEDAGPAARAN